MFVSFPSEIDLSSSGWILLLAAASFVAFLSRAINNVFLHDLADVPGPFLAALSGIPSCYHAWRGDRHVWLWQLFEIYGPIIRITPNTVLFRNSDAIKDIYNHKANVEKASFYQAWKKDKYDVNTLNVRDKALHAARRKMLNRCFTNNSLKAAESFVVRHINRWIDLLVADQVESDWSAPKDFSGISSALVFDIMGDLCFGTSFEIKEPGKNQFKTIPHTIDQYMQYFYPLARSPILDFILWLKPLGLDSVMNVITPQSIKAYDKFIDDRVAERVEKYEQQKLGGTGELRRDMLWFLCDAKDDAGQPVYTGRELRSEANLLVIAASDTTSTVIAAFMFYITRDAFRYNKLVREIRSTFSSAEDIVMGAQLTSCTYLKACVDETMRMANPGPSELAREVLKGGTVIQGRLYPAGAIVGSSGWATGHDAEVFGDPGVFRPERWIADEAAGRSQDDVNALRAKLNPFSQGPVSCPGQFIAQMELLITFARTLHRLDVRRPLDGNNTLGEGRPNAGWGKRSRNVYQFKEAYVAIREGPMLQFRKWSDAPRDSP